MAEERRAMRPCELRAQLPQREVWLLEVEADRVRAWGLRLLGLPTASVLVRGDLYVAPELWRPGGQPE